MSANVTFLGTYIPTSPVGDDIHNGSPTITVRNIGGQDVLYMTGAAGKVGSSHPIADVDLRTSPPFNTGPACLQTFPDIFQTALVQMAPDVGQPVTPAVGLASGLRPIGLYFSEALQKMFWFHGTFYQSFDAVGFDTNVGWGTIDDNTGGGVGEKMVGLAYTIAKNNEPLSNASIDVGGRWQTMGGEIPQAFANAYTGGRTLLMGFGNPATSTATSGPTQVGLALFAVNPSELFATPNRGVLGGQHLVKLSAHPFNGYNPTGSPLAQTRAGAFPLLRSYFSDENAFDPDTNQISPLCDRFGGGVWVSGPTRQGILVPLIIGAGNGLGYVQANPAPVGTSFTLDNLGDARVGDRIWVQTDATMTDGYDFASAFITAINGKRVTVDQFIRRQTQTPVTTTAHVGGWFHVGARYEGGASVASRSYVALQFFSIDHLAEVAQGLRAPDLVNPVEIAQLDIGGFTQPKYLASSEQLATCYSPATKRLYIRAHWLYISGGFPYDTINVYSVDA